MITKTGINWANDYLYNSSALLNRQTRKKVNCEAKLKTLHFLYYVQNELQQTDWSIANDEGFDTIYNNNNLCDNIPQEFKEIEKHMPPLPYIRESIRIIPIKTLTAKEIYREKTPYRSKTFFNSAIAMGDYAIDLHGCKNNEIRGFPL